MNIAIIHNQFARGGGMEAYLFSLVKGFQEDGDRVCVYAYEVDWDLAEETGCSVHRFGVLWPGKMRKYHFLSRCNALLLQKKFDLSLSLTRTSCQDVAVCGGVHPETIQHVRRTALLRHLYDKFEVYFEKKMFTTVPYIMAHSRTVADQIMKHYHVDEEKIKVIYPPIDTARFFPADKAAVDSIHSIFAIDDRKMTVLFVSCGHQCKGLQQLLQAFARLNPDRYELLVAGSRLPRSHPKNVKYIGYIDDLAPVYSAVDYTILPSDYEAFGLVVPESLQCGTPVIVSADVGAVELLSKEDGIVLDNNRPETLASTLNQLGGGFTVEPNFAERHGLTIKQHIEAIKGLFC